MALVILDKGRSKSVENERLAHLAKKYIWWKTPEEALKFPNSVIAQVMNIGTFEDVNRLDLMMGPEVLSKVLKTAEIGQFNARSWHYWHYRLGLAKPLEVPPMPKRVLH